LLFNGRTITTAPTGAPTTGNEMKNNDIDSKLEAVIDAIEALGLTELRRRDGNPLDNADCSMLEEFLLFANDAVRLAESAVVSHNHGE